MTPTTSARVRREARESHPPAGAFSPEFAALLDEHDRISGQHGQAVSARAALAADWTALAPVAKTADAQAAALSAREGNPTSATPNIDELNARMTQAQADEAGYAAGLDLVTADIANTKEAELARGGHGKRLAAANARLTKAADAFAAALTDALEAAEVVAWLNGHGYDTSPYVDARALSPDVASSLYQPTPTNALDVIRVVAALTTQENS